MLICEDRPMLGGRFVKVDIEQFIEIDLDKVRYGQFDNLYYLDLDFASDQEATFTNFINARIGERVAFVFQGEALVNLKISKQMENAKISISFPWNSVKEKDIREICFSLDPHCKKKEKKVLKKRAGLFGGLNKQTIYDQRRKHLGLMQSYAWYKVPSKGKIDNNLPESFLQHWDSKKKQFVFKKEQLLLRNKKGLFWAKRKNYVPITLLMDSSRFKGMIQTLNYWISCPKTYRRDLPKGAVALSNEGKEMQLKSVEQAYTTLFGHKLSVAKKECR